MRERPHRPPMSWGGVLLTILLLVGARSAWGDPAPFDLLGPTLKIHVSRMGQVLPISETPNLAPGDQVEISAELPPGQSVRYLLVAAFLRGATNPPPESWFSRAETWTRKGRSGVKVVVPEGAEQAVILLAPTTSGDFKTIVDAVRSRPGAFVRAAQDLNQASLDRSRLDAYLKAIRTSDPSDPTRLQEVSPLLARSLAIKLNQDCLKKEPDLQAPCLMDNQASLVLADTHSTSIVQALTSGSSADLIQQLSISPRAGAGYYSPYVGAVMDIARILDSFRTAQYQYLPALKIADGDDLALVLNTPPSFKPPLSVIMAALPPVEAPQIPPLRPVEPKTPVCLSRPDLVLGVEGAPLVFSTRYARNLTLHVPLKAGGAIDLPVRPDPERGGLVLEHPAPAAGGEAVEGVLTGDWGFAPFEGPRFKVRVSGEGPFQVAGDGLVAGREDTLEVTSPRAACVESLELKEPGTEGVKVPFTVSGTDQLKIDLPLKGARPGPLIVDVREYGLASPQPLKVEAFAEARRLSALEIHAGDASAVLKGSRLDEVDSVQFAGVAFHPAGLKREGGEDQLTLAPDTTSALSKIKSGEQGIARIALKDGGSARLKVEVRPPRPQVTLLSKTIESPAAPGPLQLAADRQLPQGAMLTFSISAKSPDSFPDDIAVEVAGADGRVLASLTPQSGLVLEDPHIVVARLDTAKKLPPSAFGPLMYRVVEKGSPSDWQPLATLVRVPVLRDLRCAAGGCELLGTNLFLIDAISADPGFERPVQVPEGFTGGSLGVPRPRGRRLYLKLHDDAAVVDEASFPDRAKVSSPVSPGGR